jgi:hypothetical protein
VSLILARAKILSLKGAGEGWRKVACHMANSPYGDFFVENFTQIDL